MSGLKKSGANGFKTWIEIDRSAVQRNVQTFRKLLAPQTQLWAVVKSNAYGHGLILFTKLADTAGVDGFCVDSVIEGLKLRQNGIEKPILVLGPTLNHDWFKRAKTENITLTVSNAEALHEIVKAKHAPKFHLKIDTGMHRQGILLRDLQKSAQEVKSLEVKVKSFLTGVYTHFAMPQNRRVTEKQFEEFQNAVAILERAGFKNLIKHVSATGGALADPRYHLDAVRIGAGLYGFLPFRERGPTRTTRGQTRKQTFQLPITNYPLPLNPVLSWYALVSEIKEIPKGDSVGYDITERLARRTRIAIIPIGYWHGYPRAASSRGEVLIRGRRARVLGRVSMDLVAIDVTGISAHVGDQATLIGKQGRAEITADQFAAWAGTSNYEALTRLNPLMERIVVIARNEATRQSTVVPSPPAGGSG